MASPVAALPLKAFLKARPLEPSTSLTTSSSTSEGDIFEEVPDVLLAHACDPRLLAGYAALHTDAITVVP